MKEKREHGDERESTVVREKRKEDTVVREREEMRKRLSVMSNVYLSAYLETDQILMLCQFSKQTFKGDYWYSPR